MNEHSQLTTQERKRNADDLAEEQAVLGLYREALGAMTDFNTPQARAADHERRERYEDVIAANKRLWFFVAVVAGVVLIAYIAGILNVARQAILWAVL